MYCTVSQSMHAHQLQYRERPIFPTFGSTTTSKMADAAREFHVMRVNELKKYLTDRLIIIKEV